MFNPVKTILCLFPAPNLTLFATNGSELVASIIG